ncbi:MAG: hypothetical protein RIT45_1103 [Pseudomonadota bacterium]|jgi:thiamine-monophosphate kinase
MNASHVGDVGERALVAAIRARIDAAGPPVASPDVPLALGDDTAILSPSGALCWTLDAVSAGNDWLIEHTPPAAVGHRAAAVNLSDLAAMGARPAWLLLGLELDPGSRVDAVLEGVDGLLALAGRHGARVVGGDVGIRRGPDTWTVTALGHAPAHPFRRDAARAGDRVWLIGAVGMAALGLQLLQRQESGLADGWRGEAVRAHRWPEPRCAAATALAERPERIAAIDLSDGLGVDAARLADASHVHLALHLDALPWLPEPARSDAERLGLDWRRAVAAGGDDYALLICAPPGLDVAALSGAADALPIGVAGEGVGVSLHLLGATADALLGGHEHGGESAAPALVAPRASR